MAFKKMTAETVVQKQSSAPAAERGLVQLNRRTERATATVRDQLQGGPVADKYFTLGSIFGLLGSILLGSYLWLTLNGMLPPHFAYAS
ncbi:MAG: hypothetical protein KDD69_06795, partial [Bdellovibrionales bacterium]|nr:hypothetical protein [Bdellovibrionales bacterium]